MSVESRDLELPENIERYLAALSCLYEKNGNELLREILVNSKVRVLEETCYDGIDGGQSGHSLFLEVPEKLFLKLVDQKDLIQRELLEDLNNFHSIPHEYIADVCVELDLAMNHDWRINSGLLHSEEMHIPRASVERIWGSDGFRLFLSHKAKMKKETALLKRQLGLFGISCFVAHQDIHPTEVWQNEIEAALSSMDGFVALMTEDFHDSDWTDQEVGFAFARKVPLVAVRLGKDPYGFIGKFQALPSNWDTIAVDLVKVLIKYNEVFRAYIRALRRCQSWDDGNTLGKALPGLKSLSSEQIDELVAAYNETDELRGSFAFNGANYSRHGPGLVYFLNRLGSREFQTSAQGLVEPSS